MSVIRTQFDWIVNGPYVRGYLRDARTAVRRGHFDGPSNRARRTALLKAIKRLQKEPDLSPRAICAIARLVLEMDNPFALRPVEHGDGKDLAQEATTRKRKPNAT